MQHFRKSIHDLVFISGHVGKSKAEFQQWKMYNIVCNLIQREMEYSPYSTTWTYIFFIYSHLSKVFVIVNSLWLVILPHQNWLGSRLHLLELEGYAAPVPMAPQKWTKSPNPAELQRLFLNLARLKLEESRTKNPKAESGRKQMRGIEKGLIIDFFFYFDYIIR